METDKEAETFSKALFTYLWFTENLVSGSAAAQTVGDMSDFIAEVAKAVVVLSALTVPSFNESMEEYFKVHDMSRRSVFTFLASYCFDNHEENEDIFCVVLNTCTFVYRLVIFCQHRGHVEYIQFASMCWTEIFEMDLKRDFYAKGGWEYFKRYVSYNCYIPRDKDTDFKAFINFLDEINYLFPKLRASDPDQQYTMSNNLQQQCQQIVEGNYSEMVRTLNPLSVDVEFYQSCDSGEKPEDMTTNIESVGDQYFDQKNDDPNIEEQLLNYFNSSLCINTSNLQLSDQDASEDSDEEVYRDLVKVSLRSIRRIDAIPPSDDCVVCKSSLNDLRTVSSSDNICLKHDRESFYYLATHSDTEENI